ncbi:MAG TPA: rRNA adenine dimethyltransferase family protein [Candidatus Thermoplasmatota archaeon]|nr:rRNA adenine dimethyltransferase family protein [Candidatus Thermoplasmatota archaeon]
MRKTDPETRASGSHYLQAGGPVVAKLVSAAALKPGESVLDAGAGLGSITEPLCQAVALGGSVLAVEQDEGLAERMRDERWPGLRVVAGDVLKVNLPEPLHAVVANPPYRILPALIRRLLDHGFGRAVLVVPAELADRLTAAPKTELYGRLTVQVAARAKCEWLFPVPKRSFDPPPAVPSAAIRITPKPAVSLDALELAILDDVLDAAWDGRKRTLRHSLSPLAATLRLPPQDVSEAVAMVKGTERRFADVSPWEYTVVARHLALCVRAGKKAEMAAKKQRRRSKRAAGGGPGGPGGNEAAEAPVGDEQEGEETQG